MNPRKWSRESARGFIFTLLLLVTLGVPARGSVRLGMKLVAHAAGCLPRVQQRFAFVESVLVFHPLTGTNFEFHRFLFEFAFLRHDDGGLAGAARGRLGKRLNFLTGDAKLQQ